VPRIPDRLLDCVVYLYPSEAAAEDGERMGGSAFIIGLPIADDNRDCVTAIVTNKHVIERGNMVARLNRIDGKLDPIPLDGERWFTHPAGDDLAVCLVGLNKRVHKIEYLAPGEWCGEGRVEMLNIGPVDDCFIVGRFISRDGEEKNVPTVRFGNIAQMPGEPIVQDDGFKQESFLVEARSIPGYSGSPVFIQIPATPQKIKLPPHWPEHLKNDIHTKLYGQAGGERRASLPVPVGPWLLGIDYCQSPRAR
jgi:hypothetical protein